MLNLCLHPVCPTCSQWGTPSSNVEVKGAMNPLLLPVSLGKHVQMVLPPPPNPPTSQWLRQGQGGAGDLNYKLS